MYCVSSTVTVALVKVCPSHSGAVLSEIRPPLKAPFFVSPSSSDIFTTISSAFVISFNNNFNGRLFKLEDSVVCLSSSS